MSRVAVRCIFDATICCAVSVVSVQTACDGETAKGKIVLLGMTNPADPKTSLVNAMARDASTKTLAELTSHQELTSFVRF